jgi:hypothetical protein
MCQECARMCQECARMCQECARMCQECARNVPECARMCQECARMCQECARMCQNVPGMCQNVPRMCQIVPKRAKIVPIFVLFCFNIFLDLFYPGAHADTNTIHQARYTRSATEKKQGQLPWPFQHNRFIVRGFPYSAVVSWHVHCCSFLAHHGCEATLTDRRTRFSQAWIF